MVLIHHLKPEVIAEVRSLIIEDPRLKEYMDIFDKEITRGLDKDTYEGAAVKTIVSHVNKLPTGEEEGQFLGLDFSGPTIKIMLVVLKNKEFTVTQKLYDVPEKYMTGKSERLFDFIAKSIVKFLSNLRLKMRRIPLGVTFGFPIEQTSLQECKLLRWSKGFKCDDLLDKNIFFRLKNSIRKFPELKKIYVIGILNDSVSAVLATGWKNPTCKVGAVIGPGASCCYVEKVYRITKYEAENYGIRHMYMNLESAQLGEDGCLNEFLTSFDQTVDEESENPGKIINHKLISTDYFGELVRLILLSCVEKNIILDGQIPDLLLTKDAIKLDVLREMESNPDDLYANCRNTLMELGFNNVTDEDCIQVQFICRCVYRRSANLVAAQLATLINRINDPELTIVLDGDLIKNYPYYKWYLVKKIKQLKNEECSFQVEESDEINLGPAILAAIFGEEIMDRDEKFRRLPGFPMDNCHFKKVRKCLNPDCKMRDPCDVSGVNPLMKSMKTTSQDLFPTGCDQKTEKQENQKGEKDQIPKRKSCGGGCKGYREMP